MTIIERFACRAVLLTPDNYVLLLKLRNPDTAAEFWINPGGGIEPNEDHMSGLKRELFEEIGVTNVNIGPHIWNREHEFVWEGRHLLQREAFYLVKVEKFKATRENMGEGPEARAFKEFKWWGLEEIQSSSEAFAPRDLGELLNKLITNGPPSAPISVDV
jgi:8-oxo-dGTP pyrophosphatase MutT (NUDIX family)